jgi:hypothetical protein
MEARFGHDFSRVRIHTGALASASVRAVNALAYTVGHHVVFAAGHDRSASGDALLAHELAHVVQQRGAVVPTGEPLQIDDESSPAEAEAQRTGESLLRAESRVTAQPGIAAPLVQRAGGGPGQRAPAAPRIDTIIVDQATPQTVTINWSDGRSESDACSTGKGHCCLDETAAEGGACSAAGSLVSGSNCTPLGTFRVTHRIPETGGGVRLWTQFHPRSIALHEYTPVDGTPLSHGCVRLHEPTAQKIYDGSVPGRTRVTVRNLAQPHCSHPALRDEWINDFATAGAMPPDGETIDPVLGRRLTPSEAWRRRRSITTERRALRSALGTDEPGLTSVIEELKRSTGDFAASTPEEVWQTRTEVAQRIPRCVPTLTRAEAAIGAAATPGSSGTQAARVQAFRRALQRVGSLRAARQVVRQAGRDLWDSATDESAPGRAPTNYRMLERSHLELASALRAYEPAWMRAMNPDQARRARAELLSILERAARGMESAEFSALVESHVAFLRSRPGGAGGAVREHVATREFRRTRPSWDDLDLATQSDWRRRAEAAIAAVTASVRGTDLEPILSRSELVFNPEDAESFDPPAYAYSSPGSNRLFFGLSWVQDVEQEPRSVWPNIAHELGGHEEYGTTWSWAIAQAALARLTPEERAEAHRAGPTAVLRSAYGYPETEIYAELRELPYRIAEPGGEETAEEEAADEIRDHLIRMVFGFGLTVAGQIALRLYHRALDEPGITLGARRVLYNAIREVFPDLVIPEPSVP